MLPPTTFEVWLFLHHFLLSTGETQPSGIALSVSFVGTVHRYLSHAASYYLVSSHTDHPFHRVSPQGTDCSLFRACSKFLPVHSSWFSHIRSSYWLLNFF